MDMEEKKIADEMMKGNRIAVAKKYHITTSYYAGGRLVLTDRTTNCQLIMAVDSVYAMRGDYLWQLTVLWAKHHNAKYIFDIVAKIVFTME
jgi:hypothetical protein